MSQATQLHIQDASGKQMFKTVCSTEFKAPEIRNLERHLNQAKKNPAAYGFMDIATARIYEDGKPMLTDDELLAEFA